MTAAPPPSAVQDAAPALVSASPVRAALPGVRADAWRIEYRTDGQAGPTIATGAVLVPHAGSSAGAAPGGRARAVVGVALGSQGLADECAPSRNLATGGLIEAPMLAQLVARGVTVVVGDGLGLGSTGLPTYGAAALDGPALLAAVRAARELPAAGISASWPVGLLGYSVGAASVDAAAAAQPAVAPDLPLAAAAAGGAPVDLAAYVRRGLASGATVAALSALSGLRTADPSLPPPPLTSLGVLATAVAQRSCIYAAIGVVALLGPARADRFVTGDPFADPQWQAAAAAQVPASPAPRVPVLLFHAARDQAVPIAGAERLRDAWRAEGADVRWWSPPVDHVGGLYLAVPRAIDWLLVRLRTAGPSSQG